MMRPPRPLGISILGIIELVFGVLAALVGAVLIGTGSAMASSLEGTGELGTITAGELTSLISAIGGVALVAGVVGILIGWGLWTGRGWARIVAIIFVTLGVIFSLLTIVFGVLDGIFGLVVDGIILWYLFRPNVKAFFGKGEPSPAGQPYPASTTT